MKPNEEVVVPPLQYGIVVNHLPAGTAYAAKELLDLGKVKMFTLEYVDSTKYGTKDMIKVDNIEDEGLDSLVDKLKETEEKLSLISPDITLYVIRDGKIEKRYHPQLPDIVEGTVSCKNRKCVTNSEPDTVAEFRVHNNGEISLKCAYCEEELSRKDILDALVNS